MSMQAKSIFVLGVLAMATAVQGCPSENAYLLIEKENVDVEAVSFECIAFSDTFPGSTSELSVGSEHVGEMPSEREPDQSDYKIAMSRVGESMLFRVTMGDELIVQRSLDLPFILSGEVDEVEFDLDEWGLFRYRFQGVSACPEGSRPQDMFGQDAGVE